MQLIPLGVSGAYPKVDGATSGYLVKTDSVLLFDVGSGVVSRIQKYVNIMDIKGIFLTHYHFDHICDLFVLRHHEYLASGNKITVYGPKSSCLEGTAIKNYPEFNFVGVNVGDEIKIGQTTVKVGVAKHVNEAVSYKICADKTLYYTGDTKYCQEVEDFAKDADVILCDTFKPQSKMTSTVPHMSFEEGLALSKLANAKLLGTHVHPNCVEDANAYLGQENIAKEETLYNL